MLILFLIIPAILGLPFLIFSLWKAAYKGLFEDESYAVSPHMREKPIKTTGNFAVYLGLNYLFFAFITTGFFLAAVYLLIRLILKYI